MLVAYTSNQDYVMRHPKTIQELPKYYTYLAKILVEQPLFNGSVPGISEMKVLHLESYVDAKIAGIINRNSIEILGINSWGIYSFWEKEDPNLYDSNHQLIPQGLNLWITSYDDRHRPCTLDVVQASYLKILETMQTGWMEAKIEEHPEILHQDPHLFFLFIKTKSLLEESRLINHIAKLFSMEEDVRSTDLQLLGSAPLFGHTIYLWVKRSSLSEFIEKFDFKFNLRE